MATRTPVTVDDVLRLAEQGKNYELVNGELLEMSPTGSRHGQIEGIFALVIGGYVDQHDLGTVLVGDVLFLLDREAGLARAADVAFVRVDRWPGDETPLGAFVGAPDLAVEIISPSNTEDEIQEKVGDWLNYGSQAVLLVYMERRVVVLWNKTGAIRLSGDDELDLDPIIAGFRCKVSALFPRRGRRTVKPG